MENKTNYNIGRVIKLLRTKKGISQDSLAADAGLSKGLISQIENNKVIPSFTNIKKIAQSLHIELSKLFFYCENEMVEHCCIVRREEQKCYESRGVRIRELRSGLENASMSPNVLELEAGNGTVVHKHEGLEFIYLVSGRARIHIGGESFDLQGGDYALIESMLQHRLENMSSSRIQLISINVHET